MMFPLQSGNPQASSARFTWSANTRSFALVACRSTPSRSGKMMALSWSVASVCSLRPSLPRPIQQKPISPTSWSRSASSIARSVTASLSAEMNWVSCSAATPCASIAVPSSRTSRAAKASASTLLAWPMSLRSPCIDRRCSPKRSRSEMTPSSLPPSATSTWRNPRRAMSCAASESSLFAESAVGLGVITSDTGRSSGRSASATRLSRSVRVKMPVGAPPLPTRTIEPIRRAFMSSSTCRTLAVSGSVTGAWRIAFRRGEAIVSSSAARLE